MLFHAISLFMRLKGNRVKPRAYQAATTNGYRHESWKLLISSGVLTHFRIGIMKHLSSGTYSS
jgi:hypothetical protein